MNISLKIAQFWLFVIATVYLSLTPKTPGAMAVVSDKLLHLLCYLMLLFSCEMAYPKKNLRARFLLIFGFSLALEIIQYFVPNRHFSPQDLLANLTGLTIGALLLTAYKKMNNTV